MSDTFNDLIGLQYITIPTGRVFTMCSNIKNLICTIEKNDLCYEVFLLPVDDNQHQELKTWCFDTYGIIVEHNYIAFQNEQDLNWFLLKWS